MKLVSVLRTLEAGLWHDELPWAEYDTPERMIDAGLAADTLPLACVAYHLLCGRQPDTVRGTMYAVVSAGYLPDTGAQSYGKIQRLLDLLRKKGVIPWSWIVDNVRETNKPSSWSGLQDFAETVANAYRRDYWAGMPEYVCIVVEKDTVAGRVSPITRQYDVALHALRGFSSSSFMYQIAAQWKAIEKSINCYYVGDFDPSGMEIENNIRERLAEYSGKDFSWHRLAVKPEHFDEFNIIPLAPKMRDTRYRRFVEQYGERCAEVEAVPADALRDMVEAAIKSHIPADGSWERLREQERLERESVRQFTASLSGPGVSA
ncbi:MAG: hypothetical protein ACHRHE_15205 [Tepidisphaerales bacterium]